MTKTIHVISVSGGKDSTALLELALRRCPEGSVRPIFCDTDNEDEAVYEYLDYLECRFSIRIDRLKADFADRFVVRRMYIARDQRTRREYDTIQVLDASGQPVPKRDAKGNIVMRTVRRRGEKVQEPVWKTRKVGGGRRVRWSNKAKRRALAVLHPSGNAFLDLCMLKGRFPSRKAQFCTQELKRNMAVAYQLDLIDLGHRVISWQGVRRDESDNRRNAKRIERMGPGLYAFRPLVDWTAQQVVAYCGKRHVSLNPLYMQGQDRVGCMPCINCSKVGLRQIAARFPRHIERVSQWECLVGQCSKRGFSTFFTDGHDAKDRRQIFADLNVHARVEWAKTSRGGRQFDLLAASEDSSACASSYGLCDQV